MMQSMARRRIRSCIPTFALLLCLVIANSVESNAAAAFAGGGFGNSSSSSSAASNRSKKKFDKKRKRKGFADIDQPSSIAVKQVEEEKPKLDRWGLPIPTEDELFPPLPPGTEVIPSPSSSHGTTTSLKDIKAAIKDHMSLALENFDEWGVERLPSPGHEPMKLQLLHTSPPVLSIEKFFTDEECTETKAVTTTDDVFQVSSATFSPLAQSKRTSTSWFCHYQSMPTLLAKASCRLGIPLEHMEEPQIARYQKGQEFSWHYDEVPSTQLDNGGQRIATLLVYLNTVQRGGGTIFRDLKDNNDDDGMPLTVRPRTGNALLFFPALANGRPDDRTLHKGEVADDEKWITQMWIHERPYRAAVPPGNTHEAAHGALQQVKEQLGYNR